MVLSKKYDLPPPYVYGNSPPPAYIINPGESYCRHKECVNFVPCELHPVDFLGKTNAQRVIARRKQERAAWGLVLLQKEYVKQNN